MELATSAEPPYKTSRSVADRNSVCGPLFGWKITFCASSVLSLQASVVRVPWSLTEFCGFDFFCFLKGFFVPLGKVALI